MIFHLSGWRLGRNWTRINLEQCPFGSQEVRVLVYNWLISILIAMLALSSCKPVGTVSDTTQYRAGGAETGTTTAAEEVTQPTQQNVSSTKGPGTYENVDKDAEECRQGRFTPGSHGGKLVLITVSADPKTFNPWAADDAFSHELSSLLFRALGEVDHFTGEVIPDLAAEIKEEPDHLTYTTRLRRGLHWSDGRPISADDVAFTWNTIVAQAYGNPAIREAALVEGKMPTCTADGELTNKFVLTKAHAPFKRVLAMMKVAPKHVVEPVINGRDGRAEFKQLWSVGRDQSTMVTDGPFTLVDYVPGQRVEFGRASSFYMIDKNGSTLPYLDRLVYTIEPEHGSIVLGFGKKEADLAQFRPSDKPWVDSQQGDQNYKIYDLGPSTNSFFMVFNMNQRNDSRTKKPLVDPLKAVWFNDTNFRQAVNHAIDRKQMISEFYKGAGSQLVSSEPKSSPFYNSSLKPVMKDLKLAQELLAKSGFAKKPDGFLYDKTGKKVEFTLLYYGASKLYQMAAQSISTSLKELGITANLEPLDATLSQDLIIGKKNWEAQLFTMSADPLEPNSSANVYRSNGHLHVFDQRESDWRGDILAGDARPWESRIDEIYTLAATEFDKQKRKTLYWEAQKIIYDEAPFIFLVSPDVVIGARNTVRNFSPTPLSQSSLGLHNIEEIYIDLSQTPAPVKKASAAK